MSAETKTPEPPAPWAERLRRAPSVDLTVCLRLRRGSLRDYAVLAEHHYRAAKPATATRVLVFEDTRPGVARRFAAIHEPRPAEGWTRSGPTSRSRGGKPDHDADTRAADVVAVLVESLPCLSCKMRDWALRGRYGNHLSASARAKLLNAEVRCISRVVVDPRWRGLGLAVRLVREALATPTTPVTEALAAMGKVHPFFARAGMAAYPRPSHPHDDRLLAALARLKITPADLLRLDHTTDRLKHFAQRDRLWLQRELHQWYRRSGGRSASHSTDPAVHLRAAQQRLGLEPVYYVKDHAAPTIPPSSGD